MIYLGLPWTQVWTKVVSILPPPPTFSEGFTLADGTLKEQAAMVAALTSYKITEGEVTEDDVTYPSVQSVPGWGLLMDPNSIFN